MLRLASTVIIVLLMLSASAAGEMEEGGRDGCPYYFQRIGSKCYHFSFEGRIFEDSRAYCQGLASSLNGTADLAVFGYDYVDFDSITDYLNAEDISYTIWVGLDDIFSEGQWFWLDGTPQPIASAMWECDEPANSSSANCAVLFRSSEAGIYRYRLEAYNCESTSIYSICEYGALAQKTSK